MKKKTGAFIAPAFSLPLSAACLLPLRSVWIVEPLQTDAGGNADFNEKRPVCVRFAAETKKENPGTIAVPGFLLESNYLLEN